MIDVVRDKLQDILERAAEIDREKKAHLELTSEGSLARSKMLFEMIRNADDDGNVETKTQATSNNSKKKMRRQSSRMNRTSAASKRLRRHSTGSSMQGNSTSAVHIEMGTFSSTNDSGEEKESDMFESKDDSSRDGVADLSSGLGETPFKL